MIIVSACLLGLNTRYDGNHNLCRLLLELGAAGRLLPVCPEQLGGLPTPRQAAEISGGTGSDVLAGTAIVTDASGTDLTAPFTSGAEQVLRLASTLPVTAAILKARSPSCGVGRIYDGTFTRTLRDGSGVTAAILARRAIPLYTELDLTPEILRTLLAKS